MTPGPKKRNFHTPRNPKNAQTPKSSNDERVSELNNEINKNGGVNTNLSSDDGSFERDKYSKRSLESNWRKYEEPQIDPHADSMRGNDFNVLMSYSGGSGSQLKLQDEKEWDDELTRDFSLDIQDFIRAMKCIPFHERIGLQNFFDDSTVINFVSSAKRNEATYKLETKTANSESKDDKEMSVDADLNIIEEPGSFESDDSTSQLKNVTVQDKTEDIINSLASNLTFKGFSEKVMADEQPVLVEESKSEATSNDLDFLLSLNISSKAAAKEENSTTPKNTNVDDWLNSILDD